MKRGVMNVPVIIAVVCVVLALIIVRKIKHGGGCCGEHETAAVKVRAADRELSHYPYRYRAVIEGMVCANCVRNAENALNSSEGIYALVELGSKTADIRSKRRLERREAAALLDGTSYTLTEFEEVKE